jgi:hypothetical protein
MVLQTSWDIAEEDWPPMNANKAKTFVIGVHRRPEMVDHF